MKRIIGFLLLMAVSVAWGQTNGDEILKINLPLKANADQISGVALKGSQIYIYVGGQFYNKGDKPVVVADNNTFVVTLKVPLKKGEHVEIQQLVEEKDSTGTTVKKDNQIVYVKKDFQSTRVCPYGITESLYPGQREIRGYIDAGLNLKKKDNPDKIILLFKKDPYKATNTISVVENDENIDLMEYDSDTGKYCIILKEGLKEGQLLQIKTLKFAENLTGTQIKEAKENYIYYPSGLVRVKESPLSINRPAEGTNLLQGELNLSEEKKVRLELSLYRDSNKVWRKTISLPQEENKDINAYAFSEVLPLQLQNDDKLTAHVVNDESGEIEYSKDFFVIDSTIDWGRIRLYFTYGFNMSRNDEKSLTPNGSYLQFLMNTHWLNPFLRKSRKNNTFVTYVDVRLHSNNVETTPIDSESNPSAPDVQNNEETNGTPEESPPSRKSANFQFGFYYPLMFSEWNDKGKKNTMFIAPIVKAGFLKFYNGVPDTDGPVIDLKELYFWWSAGIRMGHYILSNCNDQASDLTSYVDITIGKSKATAILMNPEAVNNNPPKNFRCSWNIYIEGHVKIPFSPFYAGIEASDNIARGNTPSDFRIILGSRFDVLALVDKIWPKL